MIISASYRTDIPAFYSEWFFERLKAGYCRVRNPYSGRAWRVELRPECVDGFVFWTRNFGPLLGRLAELRRFGRPFVVQYTVTGYPRSLEAAVVAPAKAVEQIRRLAGEVHPRAVVWRYDPVVFTSVTKADRHRREFARLAAELEGAVDEVVVSFAQIYRKSERNLNAAALRHAFEWEDPADEIKLRLAAELAAIARSRGMTLALCNQPRYVAGGAREARCVDAQRLSEIGGIALDVPVKGNRPHCLCHESRDIGDYDTCPHGCVYCYAVRDRALSLRRYQAHDPAADSLVPLPAGPR